MYLGDNYVFLCDEADSKVHSTATYTLNYYIAIVFFVPLR